MGCFEDKTKLSDYINNELNPKEANLVREHISSCSNCKAELEYYTKFKAVFKNRPPFTNYEDIQKKTLARAESYHNQTRHVKFIRISMASVAAVLLLFGVWFFYTQQKERTEKIAMAFASLESKDEQTRTKSLHELIALGAYAEAKSAMNERKQIKAECEIIIKSIELINKHNAEGIFRIDPSLVISLASSEKTKWLSTISKRLKEKQELEIEKNSLGRILLDSDESIQLLLAIKQERAEPSEDDLWFYMLALDDLGHYLQRDNRIYAVGALGKLAEKTSGNIFAKIIRKLLERLSDRNAGVVSDVASVIRTNAKNIIEEQLFEEVTSAVKTAYEKEKRSVKHELGQTIIELKLRQEK